MHEPLSGTGKAPGTAGELLHGVTRDGRNVHVTLPINRYARVNLNLRPSATWSFASDSDDAAKLRAGITATARALDVGPFAVDGRHRSALDTGRSLGSSTADILAGSRALASAVLRTLTPEQEARIARSIEDQVDGTMYTGLTALDRSSGQIIDRYPWWPQFALTMLVSADSAPPAPPDAVPTPDFDELLRDLSHAAHTRDGQVFADAATRSALQRHGNADWFPQLDEAARDLHADGIVVSRSGTVAGLMFLVDGHRHSRRNTGPAFRSARRATRALRQNPPFEGAVSTVRTPPSGRR